MTPFPGSTHARGPQACRRRCLFTLAGLLAAALCLSTSVSGQGASAGSSTGSFVSSDALLNKIWQVSVQTARSMVVAGPLRTDATGRACVVRLPLVIIDGLPRDRCPYDGDLAVTGLTLELSTPADVPIVRSMLKFFAQAQEPSGAIPGTPDMGGQVLFDYNAYWVMDLYDYVLYSGDTRFAAQVWPNLLRLMNRWYVSQEQAGGLLVNRGGLWDYSYFASRQPLVAYFNAQYALALEDAARLARWIGHPLVARRWLQRVKLLAGPFNRTFWDPAVGAYRDSPTGPLVHPEDGNAFAILAGLATRAQARTALAHLESSDDKSYGNTIADTNAWDNESMADTAASDVAYPFMSYFEVLARFQEGETLSALDLISREWGYMVKYGPHLGMWELIGPFGSPPPVATPSWDHGWSSGAAPALTNELLGVTPTSPGYRTFSVHPQPGGLSWARGSVPTPRGNITVSWQYGANGNLDISVSAPRGDVRS